MLKVQAIDAVYALLNAKNKTEMSKTETVDTIESLLTTQLRMISEASGLEMSYLITCLQLSHLNNLHRLKQAEKAQAEKTQAEKATEKKKLRRMKIKIKITEDEDTDTDTNTKKKRPAVADVDVDM